MVEECEKAIQERNRIISLTPKKAPALPSKTTEPDWLARSLPTATPARSTQSQNSLSKWFPYLALVAIVALIILLLQ